MNYGNNKFLAIWESNSMKDIFISWLEQSKLQIYNPVFLWNIYNWFRICCHLWCKWDKNYLVFISSTFKCRSKYPSTLKSRFTVCSEKSWKKWVMIHSITKTFPQIINNNISVRFKLVLPSIKLTIWQMSFMSENAMDIFILMISTSFSQLW